MRDVNLSNIYLHMMRFYGVEKFEVFSEVDKKTLRPKQTMVEFYCNSTKRVNHPQLQKILERDIKNSNKFFIVVEENKIIIHINFDNRIGIFDFEYSLN